MGFSQQQLIILGVANDIGENVGILPEIACNKFPPWVVLSCGALCCFLGYGVIWLAVSQTVQNMPYWVLCFCCAMYPGNPCGNVYSYHHLQKMIEALKRSLDIYGGPATFIQAAVSHILEKNDNKFFRKTLNLLKQSVDICFETMKEIPCLYLNVQQLVSR